MDICISILPSEILDHIFWHCDCISLCRAAQTCSKWAYQIANEKLWRSLCTSFELGLQEKELEEYLSPISIKNKKAEESWQSFFINTMIHCYYVEEQYCDNEPFESISKAHFGRYEQRVFFSLETAVEKTNKSLVNTIFIIRGVHRVLKEIHVTKPLYIHGLTTTETRTDEDGVIQLSVRLPSIHVYTQSFIIWRTDLTSGDDPERANLKNLRIILSLEKVDCFVNLIQGHLNINECKIQVLSENVISSRPGTFLTLKGCRILNLTETGRILDLQGEAYIFNNSFSTGNISANDTIRLRSGKNVKIFCNNFPHVLWSSIIVLDDFPYLRDNSLNGSDYLDELSRLSLIKKLQSEQSPDEQLECLVSIIELAQYDSHMHVLSDNPSLIPFVVNSIKNNIDDSKIVDAGCKALFFLESKRRSKEFSRLGVMSLLIKILSDFPEHPSIANSTYGFLWDFTSNPRSVRHEFHEIKGVQVIINSLKLHMDNQEVLNAIIGTTWNLALNADWIRAFVKLDGMTLILKVMKKYISNLDMIHICFGLLNNFAYNHGTECSSTALTTYEGLSLLVQLAEKFAFREYMNDSFKHVCAFLWRSLENENTAKILFEIIQEKIPFAGSESTVLECIRILNLFCYLNDTIYLTNFLSNPNIPFLLQKIINGQYEAEVTCKAIDCIGWLSAIPDIKKKEYSSTIDDLYQLLVANHRKLKSDPKTAFCVTDAIQKISGVKQPYPRDGEFYFVSVVEPPLLKFSKNYMEIRNDSESFETICGSISLSAGKWFYEVMTVTDGIMQIGWISNVVIVDAKRGNGVGDVECSYGIDCYRHYLWWQGKCDKYHVSNMSAWKSGDIIGCYIDLDECLLTFTLNGKIIAKPTMKCTLEDKIYPAASLSALQHIIVVFDSDFLDLPEQLKEYKRIGGECSFTPPAKKRKTGM